MKLSRTVVRLPGDDKQRLDRLAKSYFEETEINLSRAAVVRVLVADALTRAAGRKATDVLPEATVKQSMVRVHRIAGGKGTRQ